MVLSADFVHVFSGADPVPGDRDSKKQRGTQ